MSRLIAACVFVSCASVLVQLDGCSVYRAANQPSRKDLKVLEPGTSRDRVVAELGAPVTSDKTEDGRKEIYTFVQGYSTGAKASRAVFHGAADFFALGLWEVAGTPIEGAFDGKKISVNVIYDSNDVVVKSDTISVTKP